MPAIPWGALPRDGLAALDFLLENVGFRNGHSHCEATLSCSGKVSVSMFTGSTLDPGQLKRTFAEEPGTAQERKVLSQLFAVVPCNRHLIRRSGCGGTSVCLESDFPNGLVSEIALSLGLQAGGEKWCEYARETGREFACAFAVELGNGGARARFYDMVKSRSDLDKTFRVLARMGLTEEKIALLQESARTFYRGAPVVFNFECSGQGWAAKLEFPDPPLELEARKDLPESAAKALAIAETWGPIGHCGIRISPWKNGREFSFYSGITPTALARHEATAKRDEAALT